MDVALARAWIAAITAAVTENADYLTQLDSAIGDADHGVNLRRGFTAVNAALESFEAATVGDVLVKTGSTLVSKVGGASGPLYGTAFRAMGKALPEATVDATALGKALRAGLEGVQKLGDLHAAAEAARQAAEEGMQATTPLQARKGRASYLGPRSVGHQDPGATSTWLMFKALAEVTA
jgi:phosphoenolpyruvate---glycerone phosphotransferase subunit DhaL